MGQNPGLLLQSAFHCVDEDQSAILAGATATLADAAFRQRDNSASGLRIHLHGELGAGKTTFVRHFLRALGIAGRIKSPSFSVVESYMSPQGMPLHHFDFYRQSDPVAWQGGGLRDLMAEPAITLIEWPEKAQGLPAPHIQIALSWAHEALADAPREIAFSFFDGHDGIALTAHLPQWQHDTRALAMGHPHA